jgi:hypothetical protein
VRVPSSDLQPANANRPTATANVSRFIIGHSP